MKPSQIIVAIVASIVIVVIPSWYWPSRIRSDVPSLLNVMSWCDIEKGDRIGERVCMLQTYTKSGGLVITVNRSIVSVPVRLEFVDTIPQTH